MGDVLKLIEQALVLSQALQSLIPQIEQNFADVKDALGSHDEAALRAKIDTLHAETNNLTAQINALRDPVVS